MSQEDSSATIGTEPDTSGGTEVSKPAEGSAQGSQSGDSAQAKPKSIKAEDHERAISDMHRFKDRSRQLESELQQMRSQLDEVERSRLREKEDYKSLYERSEAERQELFKKHQGLQDSITLNAKYAAVKTAAVKAGLRSEAEDDLSLLDFDGVTVETTSEGRVITHGQDLYVESIKKKKPHWFKPDKAPSVNSGGGPRSSVDLGEITGPKLYELEQKAKRSGRADDKEAYLKARNAFFGKRNLSVV